MREEQKNVIIREPQLTDENDFLAMTFSSITFHQPWVSPPLKHEDFVTYLQRSQQPNMKSFIVCTDADDIVGVFNLSEIVRGCFQNAYLGFYASCDFADQGLMSKGLALVLHKAFTEMSLHRIEANIQPNNKTSIRFAKKNGFKKEGFSPRYLKINDEWCDHERFAITFEHWQSRQNLNTPYEVSNFDPAKVQLQIVDKKDMSIVQNMAQYYIYEMSAAIAEVKNIALNARGQYFDIETLPLYWQEEGRHAYLVTFKEELAGFVLLNKLGSTKEVDWNVGEFFIVRKFQNQGVGRYVANRCFNQFPGIWEVMVIPENQSAYWFWRKVISEYTENIFSESTKKVAYKENEERIIFRFLSQGSRS